MAASMPLRSQLFAGNRKLEACSKNHPDHILFGARGDHVERIQRALIRLDNALINADEMKRSFYGESTAAAVLAYKQKRDIVNRSYQSTADNIVGIMTIKHMDEELLKRKGSSLHQGICQTCGTGAETFVARAVPPPAVQPFALKAKTVTVGKTTKKRFGGVARIYVQWASGVANKGTIYPIRELIERARDMLGEYGITLIVESRDNDIRTITYTGDVIIDDDKVDIYRASLRELPATADSNRMYRVILCSLGRSTHFGETFPNFFVDGKLVPKFTLLNVNMIDKSNAVLLHEMIHASKTAPHSHDPERNSVFFQYAQEAGGPVSDNAVTQNVLKEEHAQSIARAYFSIGGG
jgi:peptidoglycan hydrolase-like protein with peptidoglycan-binding domain